MEVFKSFIPGKSTNIGAIKWSEKHGINTMICERKKDKHQFHFPDSLLEKAVMIFVSNKGVTGLDLEGYPKINL